MMMRAVVFAAALVAAVVANADDAWVWCSSGTNTTSQPRPIPVQGVDLTTGQIVVGLNARDHVTQSRCGWWWVRPATPPTPVSNETYRVSGYALVVAAGEADTLWQAVPPKRKNRDISKRKLRDYLAARQMWEPLKAAMVERGWWETFELATTLEEQDELTQQGIALIKLGAGWTDEQIEEMIASCVARR